MATALQNERNVETLSLWGKHSCPPRLRTMREFAEQEIIIPDGPYEGMRFNCQRQPYTALWFDAVDSGQWNRFVATGPTQSGKTLCCFIIPIMFHLFEVGETVICGLPDMDMAGDKWREDLKPVIDRSQYASLLPVRGGGSRGGKVESIQFLNGATLKFMSGGGSDKSRAGFTSRVLVVTETDGMDEPGGGSREADKVTQLEARTRAYGQHKRIYMECTVSIAEGRTWREYQNGTCSQIMLQCPICREYVKPEREHLVEWQEVESAIEARTKAIFICPACAVAWTDKQRIEANRQTLLLHNGQEIQDGKISGKLTATDTFGFRWSAVNNLFVTAGDLGSDEWKAKQVVDEENAQKEMLQFVWALPYEPPQLELDMTTLNAKTLQNRMNDLPRGLVPEGIEHLTIAVDIGKYLAHWKAVAWKTGASGYVIDYGRFEIAADDLGEEKAILASLREFRDTIMAGWTQADEAPRIPDQVWIDSGYQADVVYAFCRESGERFRPIKGYGATQQPGSRHYRTMRGTGPIVRHIGDNYHINYLEKERIFLVEINADYWKTWFHRRLAMPQTEPGALTLFRTMAAEHTPITRHWTSERQVEEFVPGKGAVIRWQMVNRRNHWLDCGYIASAAAHFCGVRLIKPDEAEQKSPPPAVRRVRKLSMQNGQLSFGERT